MVARRRRWVTLAAAIPLAAGVLAIQSGGGVAVRAFDPTKAPEIQDRLLDQTADIELNYGAAPAVPKIRNYKPHNSATAQCHQNLGGNIKVNQNCLNLADPSLQGRSQAQNETSIASNPRNARQLVASENDYRRGDGTCGTQYSADGGLTWQDSTLPNGFVSGAAYGSVAREYFQASGDPAVAWDSHGNAYFSCQEFMRGAGTTNNPDASSAVYLYRSTGNGGASWTFPGTPVVTCYTGPCADFIDKPYMTVDNHAGSPFRDRVYVTWTDFSPDGSAFLYEAHSSDYGRTFSAPVSIGHASSASTALCPVTYGAGTTQGACNENQFSDPFTGSDGHLYVVYANFNNGLASSSDNHNQMLISRSTDGGATFGDPVQVANYNDLPDCATYQGGQDAGRACVPEQGAQQDSVFRATNYPSGAVNPLNKTEVVVSFGSYLNATDSGTCTANGLNPSTGLNLYNGVKTSSCANKILVSVSHDSGASFSGTGADPTADTVASSASSQAGKDQWWQWSTVNNTGEIVTSYYDRQYGSDETSGNMDISLSASASGSNQLTFNTVRVTSASMPVPTEFPDSSGNSLFFGDYTGLSALTTTAHPLWMDTRNLDLFDCGTNPPAVCAANEPDGLTANDQDIFTAAVGT
jgi:hypothetical protein